MHMLVGLWVYMYMTFIHFMYGLTWVYIYWTFIHFMYMYIVVIFVMDIHMLRAVRETR
ncbi:hypothetical protein HanIR_Chr14g0718401 [Helianthus annuus]|nr:hypothetical protein HanIR_Chr14g0718401 [Helianthus annuus]